MLLKETCTIGAPIAQVWQALTDATVIDHWTTGPARMDPRAGGDFSIYGGDVHGTTTELVPLKLLRQDWHGDDHPDRTYDVTFTLDLIDEQTTSLTVTHEASDDDAASMRGGWHEYYYSCWKNRPRANCICRWWAKNTLSITSGHSTSSPASRLPGLPDSTYG